MIDEHDLGRLTVDLPEHDLCAGDTGAVVLVHAAGEAYEVEFFTPWGETIDVIQVPGNCIEPWLPTREPLAPELKYCALAVDLPKYGLGAGQPCEVVSVYADGQACEVKLLTSGGCQKESLYFLCDQVVPLGQRPTAAEIGTWDLQGHTT